MTIEQAKKMLKAKLECLKRETSGTDFDCNRCNCDECSLNYEQGNVGEQKEALDTAIKVLEQQPCEDCVSRAEVNALYAENRPYLATHVSEFGDKLVKLPSVTPARPKGYWIERTFPYMIHDYKCSECGETIEAIAKSNFCPCCGADMRGESE